MSVYRYTGARKQAQPKNPTHHQPPEKIIRHVFLKTTPKGRPCCVPREEAEEFKKLHPEAIII